MGTGNRLTKEEIEKGSKTEQYIQHRDFLIPRKMNHSELLGSYHLYLRKGP